MKRSISVALVLLAVAGAAIVAAQSKPAHTQAPMFEVDPFWPKPLPNHWVMGSTIGLSVDAQDHVWVIHRPQTVEDNFKAADVKPPVGTCCSVAPPVLEFDQAGTLVGSWGGPGDGYEWPVSNHGITVDHKGNVWIGGNDETDTQILKFTSRASSCCRSASTACTTAATTSRTCGGPRRSLPSPRPTRSTWPTATATAGSSSSMPTAASTSGTGAPTATSPTTPRCRPTIRRRRRRTLQHRPLRQRVEGRLRLCLRPRERSRAGVSQGRHVREGGVLRQEHAAVRIGLGHDVLADPPQTYIYIANGVNEQINIVLRSTLEVLTSFGDGGRQPGQFFGVHNLDTDSKGNLYATETYTGARVQRFIFKGSARSPGRTRGPPGLDALRLDVGRVSRSGPAEGMERLGGWRMSRRSP